MRVPTRERIRAAAGTLFREYGYAGVTVRAVADAADVSPALVMKLFGSKAALYGAATRSVDPVSGEQIPRDRLGAHLVQAVAARARDGVTDPFAQGVFLAWQSPDIEVERRSFAELVHGSIGVHLGEEPALQDRSDAATCLLLGLALGLRPLGLRDRAGEDPQDEFLTRYAQLVQAALDGRP